MTGASREDMRARHYVCHCGKPTLTHCGKCERPYPCDAAVLLDALDEAERREQTVREMCAEARPGLSLDPADCNYSCNDGECTCSGVFRVRAWNLDPAAVLRALDATPATTCADCGTTRTLCDAGLNTNDTRCCEQCGHGEGK